MRDILRLSLPITQWLVAFSLVYAMQGLACSRHWPPGLDARVALAVVAGGLLAVQAALIPWVLSGPPTSLFVRRVAQMIATAALLATVWTMIPVLFLTIC